MGRLKQGLDYFPMSTDFIHDRIVRRVMKHEGDSAFVILVETFSYIYSGKGYYVVADDEFFDELADNLFNTDVDEVKRAILLSVKYGLFDQVLFQQYRILTSGEIQRQYLFITKRRSGSLIEPDYCLLEAEELTSYRSSGIGGSESAPSVCENEVVAESGDTVTQTVNAVTDNADVVTLCPENATVSTQNKRKEIKTNKTKINLLPNPPQGGDAEESIRRKKRGVTQEDIDALQVPSDCVNRNFNGLVENLRLYRIPPAEQYAIIRKSNFGAIGNPVWKGLEAIRSSSGKIKLPGHYLLSVLN